MNRAQRFIRETFYFRLSARDFPRFREKPSLFLPCTSCWFDQRMAIGFSIAGIRLFPSDGSESRKWLHVVDYREAINFLSEAVDEHLRWFEGDW